MWQQFFIPQQLSIRMDHFHSRSLLHDGSVSNLKTLIQSVSFQVPVGVFLTFLHVP